MIEDSTQSLRLVTSAEEIFDVKDTEIVKDDFVSVLENSISSEVEKTKELEHCGTESENVNSISLPITEKKEFKTGESSYNLARFHSSISFDLSNISSIFGFKDSKTYSQKTQRWLGIVESVSANKFTAKLEDLTNGGTNEIGEFDFQDVSPEDLDLLSNGAAFYWSVGYNLSNTQIKKESVIRFKRAVDLDSDTIDRIKDEADSRFKFLSNG